MKVGRNTSTPILRDSTVSNHPSLQILARSAVDIKHNILDVWTHGDFIAINPATNQVLFLGRSDGVLNPSGVRFGSAEIYNVIDTQFPKEIVDSVCVGQRRPQDSDESVILFLLMRPGFKADQPLIARIKEAIRKALSARHVPKFIFETPAIPVRSLPLHWTFYDEH